MPPAEAYDVQELYPEVVAKIMALAEEARRDLGDALTGWARMFANLPFYSKRLYCSQGQASPLEQKSTERPSPYKLKYQVRMKVFFHNATVISCCLFLVVLSGCQPGDKKAAEAVLAKASEGGAAIAMCAPQTGQQNASLHKQAEKENKEMSNAGSTADTIPSRMVWIEGGTFAMGADDAVFPDAAPVHNVTLSGF
ncbi:hypothetical protein GCM10027443_40760 [Pontibacter brevis]